MLTHKNTEMHNNLRRNITVVSGKNSTKISYKMFLSLPRANLSILVIRMAKLPTRGTWQHQQFILTLVEKWLSKSQQTCNRIVTYPIKSNT